MQDQVVQKPLIWVWQKKPIPLDKLEDNQLYSIKQSILVNRSKIWFGTERKVWLTAIDNLTRKRGKINEAKIFNEIENRRIKNAFLKANFIINNIIKSSIQTLSVKQLCN